MDPQKQSEPFGEQPVAYDEQGRPLYLRPADNQPPVTSKEENKLHVVQVTRSTDPLPISVSPEAQAKHDASRKKYPTLNLTAGEYVILNIRRHPIGLFSIWLVALFLAAMIVGGWWFLLSHPGSEQPIVSAQNAGTASFITIALLALVGLFSWVATVVYRANIFILTNESVIQTIQNTLLSRSEKTINLENVKDARFEQHGIVQHIVGYGSIHLTTEGDQDNYTFQLVAKPRRQIAIINNVIEAVKYGRPVEDVLKSFSPTA